MGIDALAEPHHLCPPCRLFCTTSVLLHNIPHNHAIRKQELNDGRELTIGPKQVETFDIHEYSSFRQCATEASCHLCAIIWAELHESNSFKKIQARSSRNELEIKMIKGTVTSGGSKDAMAHGLLTFSVGGEECGSSVMLLPNSAPETAPLETRHDAQLAQSTGSRITMALAQEWLRSCLASHVACASQRKSAVWTRKLPRRLIELSSTRPRIIHTMKLPCDTAYLTLSHMWGDAQFLKLLSTNIDQLCVEIPDEWLSQTHRDALSITRGLGYEYIWIDSLCIIQDSSSDWRSQSALMASIYGNSTCTIAAASGAGRGCYVHRNPLVQRPCCLTESTTAETLGMYALPYHSVAWSDYNNHYYFKNPILKRGWIQQERILSPRILYFGKEEIHWECCSLQASETWPNGPPNSEHGHDYVFPLKAAFETQLKPHWQWYKSDHHAFIVELWHKGILEAYTRAHLTYEKDRLVALAGIASVIQQRTEMTYVAGLWKELMPAELLWSNAVRPEPGQSHHTNMPWRAPSWSWASSMGRKTCDVNVFFMFPSDEDVTYVSRVLACAVNPLGVGDTVLGEVAGGTITLTGFLVTLTKGGTVDDPGVRGHVSLDIDISHLDVLYHLCLIRLRDDQRGTGVNHGLVLARVNDNTQSADRDDYVRVGVFIASYPLGSGCRFDDLGETQVTIH